MADQLYMDVPAVQAMGKRCDDIGEILQKVSNVLEVCMTILKTTAFVGLVGGIAVERYLEQLKPVIDELAEKNLEFGRDLRDAADAYQRGDSQGSSKFH